MRPAAAVAAVAIVLYAALPLAQSPAPPQIDFSTYFGGSLDETVTALRVDAAGNIYVAGETLSSDLPVTRDLSSTISGRAGFLLKLRADRSLVYALRLERPVVALAVDAAGNAIVADTQFIGNRFSGALDDVVLTKVNATGSAVIYSSRIAGRGVDRATAMEYDATGALIVVGQTTSVDFPVVNAGTDVPPAGTGTNAFIVKVDAAGKILFSTVWGGRGEDIATAVAIDRNLDIVVAGTTESDDFVTTANAFQRVRGFRDAFVLRLSGDGQTVRYSTLFGGTDKENVSALALDRAGSPHLAGVTWSSDLPLKNALQATCDSTSLTDGCSGYVAKLTPDGSALQYSTYFGSQMTYLNALGRVINGLSIDQDGSLLAVGSTLGNDLPVWRAVQRVNGSGPVFKSTDEGRTWSASSAGLAGTGVGAIAAGGRPQVLYSVPIFTSRMYRSDDSGASWQARRIIGYIAVDPVDPSTVYGASSSAGAVKTTDGGETWRRLPLDQPSLSRAAVAPSSPSHVYMASDKGIFHSANGGVTWEQILETTPSVLPLVQSLSVDPQNAEAVHATLSDRRVIRHESGQQWTTLAPTECPQSQLAFGGGTPPVFYALSCGKIFKSVDRGASWRQAGFADQTAAAIAVDPVSPNNVYIASAQNGVFRSRDYGETWIRIREALEQDVRSIVVDPSAPGTIYIGAQGASNAFVTRFNAGGEITQSTYLGGVNAGGARIAVDPNGAMIVAGTSGAELPLVGAIQSSYKGRGDAFVARIVDPK